MFRVISIGVEAMVLIVSDVCCSFGYRSKFTRAFIRFVFLLLLRSQATLRDMEALVTPTLPELASTS
jgi:hypothetical protein